MVVVEAEKGTVEKFIIRFDTDPKCLNGIARVVACQHSRCSTCDKYVISIIGVSKCKWDGWIKIDKWNELAKKR